MEFRHGAGQRGLDVNMSILDQLSYDPTTGHFHWKVSKRGHVRSGARAGTVNGKGYRQIKIDQKLVAEHRLAWWFVHGEWPEGEIDHANGDPLDNRISNLRIATRQQQLWNSRKKSSNKVGLKGVVAVGNMYEARVRANGRQNVVGRFANKHEAHHAYVNAAKWCFGEFARAD